MHISTKYVGQWLRNIYQMAMAPTCGSDGCQVREYMFATELPDTCAETVPRRT